MSRCLCSHLIDGHRKRAEKWLCASAACGCAQPRPDGRHQPQHRDDRHDDLEPRRSQDFGARQPSEWPEPWEVAE